MSEKLKQNNYVLPATIVGGSFSAIAIAVGGVNKFKIEHDLPAYFDYETANTLFFGGLAVAVASLLVLFAAYRKN